MKPQIIIGLVVVLALAGCQSRYNPGNWGWFGGGGDGQATLEPRKGYIELVDPRPLVGRVLSVSVDRVQGGAVVTAVGLPATQGYFAADLVSVYQTESGRTTSKDGIVRLEFRIAPPPAPNPVVNTRSREVTAGLFLTETALQGVRQITVIGQGNQATARR